MRETRMATVVLAAMTFCLFGGLALKLRRTDPALSSAWMVTLAAPCLAVPSALFFMRLKKTDSTDRP